MPSVPPFRVWKVGREWRWAPGEKERRAAHLEDLPDGAWEMPACKRPTRSSRANAYYWGQVLGPMSEYTGHSVEELHAVMCEMFLPNEHKRLEFFNRLTGEVMVAELDKRRSSKLTGQAFYDFVEQVRVWAAEQLGVTTEPPDPDYWRKRLKKRQNAAMPELQT